MGSSVLTGLDRIHSSWPSRLAGAKIGLVVHPASVDRHFTHALDRCVTSTKFRVAALFGPQHGIRGETQDNMIEWEGYKDPRSGIRIFSLYGRTRKPSGQMLRGLDALVVDLQDVGARYYTFIWTMALIMEACRELGKTLVVLDRPNPISGLEIEGPLLDPKYKSFVGLHSLPVRHGMTIGEIAVYLKETHYPGIDLHVITMSGWRRAMWFDQTGLPWVMPSPNMPTLDTATVYPGMCLLEGTTLSEGRGTTRPFELFGAPFIDPYKLETRLKDFRLPGVFFRPLYYLPTFQKHAGALCGGCQLHVTNRMAFRPFLTAAGILRAILDLYPNRSIWKSPPYEYEETLLPIDILSGSSRLREDIDRGVSLRDLKRWWQGESSRFSESVRKDYLLYP